MPEQNVPEEVYREAALAAVHARTEHDADWGVDELVAFGEFRAAVEVAYRAGYQTALRELGDEPHHVLDLRETGWTLKHPLSCRPNLFACPVNAAAEQLDRPPARPGQWVVDLDETGALRIVRPSEAADG